MAPKECNNNKKKIMDKYTVSIWPGVGYYTKQIEVEAFNELEALEAALAYCQQKKLDGLYIDVQDVDDLDLTDEEKDEIFIYIDPSRGGCHPAYFRLENLNVQKAA